MMNNHKNRQFTQSQQELLFDIMASRRDVRGNDFVATPITEEELSKLFTAVSVAPSVGLSQPWRFVVIDDSVIKQQIYEDSCRAKAAAEGNFSTYKKRQYRDLKLEGIIEAPINIAVFYESPKKSIIGNNSMPKMGAYSVVCAVQNMWLMARAMNIGIGWVSILNPKSVANAVGAPDDCELVAYLCLGRVKTFDNTPELERVGWAEREPIDNFISKNKIS